MPYWRRRRFWVLSFWCLWSFVFLLVGALMAIFGLKNAVSARVACGLSAAGMGRGGGGGACLWQPFPYSLWELLSCNAGACFCSLIESRPAACRPPCI